MPSKAESEFKLNIGELATEGYLARTFKLLTLGKLDHGEREEALSTFLEKIKPKVGFEPEIVPNERALKAIFERMYKGKVEADDQSDSPTDGSVTFVLDRSNGDSPHKTKITLFRGIVQRIIDERVEHGNTVTRVTIATADSKSTISNVTETKTVQKPGKREESPEVVTWRLASTNINGSTPTPVVVREHYYQFDSANKENQFPDSIWAIKVEDLKDDPQEGLPSKGNFFRSSTNLLEGINGIPSKDLIFVTS